MAHYNSDDGLTVEIFEQNRRRLTGIAYGMLGSLMDALERLKPTQRAVLLLRDVLDMEYAEIADIVGKTPANCRQIASRARDDVASAGRRPLPGRRVETQIVSTYLDAIANDDVDALARTFSEDVILWSDGGGKARAARHPIHGAWRVARHLVGVTPRPLPAGLSVRVVRVNGDIGLMAVVDGRCETILAFEIDDDRVVAVRAILNPDKLERVLD